jgi:hypothetical protein
VRASGLDIRSAAAVSQPRSPAAFLIPWLSESPSPKEADVKKCRFDEAQIIGVLREHEAGKPTAMV